MKSVAVELMVAARARPLHGLLGVTLSPDHTTAGLLVQVASAREDSRHGLDSPLAFQLQRATVGVSERYLDDILDGVQEVEEGRKLRNGVFEFDQGAESNGSSSMFSIRVAQAVSRVMAEGDETMREQELGTLVFRQTIVPERYL